MPSEPAPITLNYSAAFLHQIKRLRKKYRRIQSDLQPLLDKLQAGATPGDQVQGTPAIPPTRSACPTAMPAAAPARWLPDDLLRPDRQRPLAGDDLLQDRAVRHPGRRHPPHHRRRTRRLTPVGCVGTFMLSRLDGCTHIGQTIEHLSHSPPFATLRSIPERILDNQPQATTLHPSVGAQFIGRTHWANSRTGARINAPVL